MIKKFIIPFCFLLQCLHGKSQVFENDAGALEKHFIYEVKQLSEFFERFNNDTNSFIRKVYQSKGIKYNVKRTALIRSLFDIVSHKWEPQRIDSFIVKAQAVQMPTNINFYGKDWYAEIPCLFDYNGDTVTIPVILQVETDAGHRSKWIIAGLRQNIIQPDNRNLEGGNLQSENSFISPASNGNDFIQLQKAFNDKEHLGAYFNSSIIKTSRCIALYNAMLKDRIKFVRVKQIKYHFLQVGGYIFTVEYFGRDELNSGWLISKLMETDAAGKDNFTHRLLGD